MASKSDTYIQFILDELKSGNVERGKMLAKVGKKWQMPARTFDRYWKKAQERHTIELQRINELKTKEYTQSEIEAFKTQILSKQEKREFLRKIVHGEVTFEKFIVVKGEPKKVQVKADAVEIMKAIDIDNRMAGDDAPLKTENNTALEIKITREDS